MEEREPNQLELAQGLTDPPAPSHGSDAPAALFFSSSDDDGESDDDEGGEFEFPFVSRDSPAGTAAPADELFADGRIRPAFYYPVFGFGHGAAFNNTAPQPASHPAPRVRGQLGRLFLEESRARNASTSSTASTESTSSSDGGGGAGLELEGAPPESYCLWTPGGSSSSSPRLPPRKSSSTGSMARWRRISELVVGRSHSDGKDKLMFFPAPQHKPNKPNNSNKPKEPVAVLNTASKLQHDKPRPPAIRKQQEVDTVHRLAYGTPRRTFLPYREELVGFFANVNGFSRSHQHPF